MTKYEIFRLVVYVIGVPIIIYLIVNAVRKLRDIRALDAKLRAEAEANKQNPYAQMAQLLEERNAREMMGKKGTANKAVTPKQKAR